MHSQSVRSHKPSFGPSASMTGTVSLSEFHHVRMHEPDKEQASRATSAANVREGPSLAADQTFFVPTLQSICADVLAQNFTTTVAIDQLRGEAPELYESIVERLPPALLPQEKEAQLQKLQKESRTQLSTALAATTVASANAAAAASLPPSLPLSVAVSRIVSEAYWKRCCLARWSSGQLSKFTGGGKALLEKQYGWKRLFLEHVLSDFLMSLRSTPQRGSSAGASTGAPSDAAFFGCPPSRVLSTGAEHLLTTTGDSKTSVERYDRHLFEPSFITDDDVRALGELCALCRDYIHTVDLPCQYTHLDWHEHLFSRLPGILNFRLSHGTNTAGVGFDKAMLGFTDHDAENMRVLLTRYLSLETLRLPQNMLNCEQTTMIAAGLIGNTQLRVLDLSRNAIGDAAVTEGLSLLLCQPEFPLQELVLNDNKITSEGARALAEALGMSRTLEVLHLGQNRIGDADGGAVLVRALGANPQCPLRELSLNNNLLGPETVTALGEVLPDTTTLVSLNLAGNRCIGGTRPRYTAVEEDEFIKPQTTNEVVAAALCEAIQQNSSLHHIDVRYCGLTTEHVCNIEGTVQSRVERLRGAERAAKEEEQRQRIEVLTANRPTGRW